MRCAIPAVLLCVVIRAPAVAAEPDARRSGLDVMSPATQAMQRDDSQNPAMLWVKDGEALWNQAPAPGAKSCASCHGNAATSMRGVAATYPAFDATLKRPVNLGERINQCRQQRQQQPPFAAESSPLLALEAYVALQSRGLRIAPYRDARLSPFFQRGEALFKQRMGQLDLACTHCHDRHAGGRLGGAPIPQGHPTGYPIYRLEWQGMGSLQRRIRTCMTGVRAEPFAFNSIEMAELETYLASRAAGMSLETPAVRP